MSRNSDRARRIVVRRRAKKIVDDLRKLVQAMAEWDRLEDADPIGVVEIHPDAGEGDYAADVLDMVAYALTEAGEKTVVEVFVISTEQDPNHHRPNAAIGGSTCQAVTEGETASTPTSAPVAGPTASSRSAASPTTRSS